MNFNPLTGTVVILMLASAAVFAADSHHDDHAAATKQAPSKDGQGKDVAAKDATSQPADEPAQATVTKKSRKSVRTKSQHKALTRGTATEPQGNQDASSADTHANTSTPMAPGEGKVSKRLRVKARGIATNAAANPAESQATSAPDTNAAHDASAAPAVNAAHDGHDAQAKPADQSSTPAPAAKTSLNKPAALAPKKSLVENDAHGSDDGHAAPAVTRHDGHAATANPVAHAAPDTHADSHSAAAKSTHAEPSSDYCNPPLKSEVAALFDRWNASLRTGDPKKVAANYAPGSVLLPTVSNRARFTTAEKEDYFTHFLARRPEGTIDDRVIDVDCNSATDSGLYTFRFSDGATVKARYSFAYRKIGSQWLITSHHSSGMPEKTEDAAGHHATAAPNQKPAERTDQSSPTKGWVRYP